MNLLCEQLNIDQEERFAVSPTTISCTRGLWISTATEIDGKIYILLDSEGLGAMGSNQNHDLRIFVLTLLVSSLFIFNSMGAIREETLQQLACTIECAKHMQGGTCKSSLLWVLRDFGLRMTDQDNNTISSDSYLEQSLRETEGSDKNRVRTSIRDLFQNRSCISLVRPVSDEEQLQSLQTMDTQNLTQMLRPEFQQGLRQIVDCIVHTEPQQEALTPDLFCDMLQQLITAINEDRIPKLEDSWSLVCQARNADLLLRCRQKLSTFTVDPATTPIDEFQGMYDSFHASVVREYEDHRLGDSRVSLDSDMDAAMKTFRMNRQRHLKSEFKKLAKEAMLKFDISEVLQLFEQDEDGQTPLDSDMRGALALDALIPCVNRLSYKLSRQHSEMRNQLTNALSDLQASQQLQHIAQEQAMNLERAAQEKMQQLERAAKTASMQEQQIHALTQQLETAQLELEASQQDNDNHDESSDSSILAAADTTALREEYESRLSDYETQLGNCQSQLRASEDRADQLESQISELEAQIIATLEQERVLEQLQQEVQQLGSEKMKWEAQAADSEIAHQDELQRIQQQALDSVMDMKQVLKQERSVADGLKKQFADHKEQKNRELEQLTDRLQRAEQRCLESHQELDRMRAGHAQEQTDWQHQATQMQATISCGAGKTRLVAAIQTLSDSEKQTKRELRTQQQLGRKLEHDITTLATKNDMLQVQVERAQKNLDQQTQKQQKSTSLTVELARQKMKASHAEKESKKLEQRCADLQQRYEKLKLDHKQLQRQSSTKFSSTVMEYERKISILEQQLR